MTLLRPKQITHQFLRYSLVGIVSNAMGYSSYLIVTSIGVGSVKGMTIVYVCACLASFAGNKQWTFGDATRTRKLFPRYVAIQIFAYATNLFLLLLLHKRLGFPHQWVQLLAIAVVATELFILSKYYVFRGAQNGARP
jgi:putative flippase GtrA